MHRISARSGDADRQRAWSVAVAALAVLLLLTSGWLTYDTVSRLSAGEVVSRAAEEELRAAYTLLSTLKDAETGQRGYLLTGEPVYLQPLDAARRRLGQDLAWLEHALPPGQADDLARVKTLVAAKMAVVGRIVALQQAGQGDAALALMDTGRGKLIMDSLRYEVETLSVQANMRMGAVRAGADAVRNWVQPAGAAALAALLFGGLIGDWLRTRRIAKARLAGRERFTRAFGLTRGMLRDIDGRITFWGAGMEALYGFTPDTAVGQISHKLLATRFPAPLEAIEAALQANGDWHGELTHQCSDGRLKTVMSHWVLYRDTASGKLSVVEMNFDIGSARQADPHRQLALDTAGLGTWIWDVGGTGAMVWDARCIALIDPPADVGQSFEVWRASVWPEDLPAAEVVIGRMLDPADPTDTGQWEFRYKRADGRLIWLASTSLAEFTADPGAASGRAVVRMVGTVQDISAAKSETLERARAASLLQTIIETTPGPIYAKDRSGNFLVANAGALALIGKPWTEVKGRRDVDVLDDPAQAAAVVANDERVMASGVAEEFEETVGSNGRARAWLSTKTPMRAADGAVIGLVGVSVEITQRKRDEARRTMMIHELNHRVKNTLATVQAVVTETMQGAEPGMRAALDGRLMALAAVHDVLTRESWHCADLGEVVAGALAPFGGGDVSRFRVQGPPMLLQPRAAVALAMGLHELATNATKYGALRADAGRVTFTWEVETPPQCLKLTWTEQGGPRVVVPSRRSFGSNMIEGALACDLAGTATIHFDPAGVRCVIEAPLDEIVATSSCMVLPPVGEV
jgi:PAS domain S-box-containing protein